jgi:hypothetical protein
MLPSVHACEHVGAPGVVRLAGEHERRDDDRDVQHVACARETATAATGLEPGVGANRP